MKWYEISGVVKIPPGYIYNLVTKPEVFPLSDKNKKRIEDGLKVNNKGLIKT